MPIRVKEVKLFSMSRKPRKNVIVVFYCTWFKVDKFNQDYVGYRDCYQADKYINLRFFDHLAAFESETYSKIEVEPFY